MISDNPPLFMTSVASLRGALLRDGPDLRLEDFARAETILTEVLAEVRRQRNTRMPVDRLPPEMLARIFTCLAPRPDESNYSLAAQRDLCEPTNGAAPTLSLLTVTHVYSKWRAVALLTPSLWTRIASDRHPEELEAFLARSKSMPITLCTRDSNLTSMQSTLKSIAYRLRRLDVITSSKCEAHEVLAQLDLQAPLLDCLTLELWQGDDLEQSRVHQQHLLSRGIDSPLKALGLIVNDFYHWKQVGAYFPNLTHLDLRDCPSAYDWEELVGSMRSLLSRTPLLQYLHLAKIYNVPWSQPAAYPPIVLASLRALLFSYTSTEIAFSLIKIMEPDTLLARSGACTARF
ncbi:hypothetical protein OH77DRAFT_637448 [Trametes cingulata]|nr:hypothetical protein OH77DRAFT_637448 [Trametes cingulata]